VPEVSKRLVLRFNRGQMSFRHLSVNASDEQLFELAHNLNAFQVDEAVRVVKVQTMQF